MDAVTSRRRTAVTASKRWDSDTMFGIRVLAYLLGSQAAVKDLIFELLIMHVCFFTCLFVCIDSRMLQRLSLAFAHKPASHVAHITRTHAKAHACTSPNQDVILVYTEAHVASTPEEENRRKTHKTYKIKKTPCPCARYPYPSFPKPDFAVTDEHEEQKPNPPWSIQPDTKSLVTFTLTVVPRS